MEKQCSIRTREGGRAEQCEMGEENGRGGRNQGGGGRQNTECYV